MEEILKKLRLDKVERALVLSAPTEILQQIEMNAGSTLIHTTATGSYPFVWTFVDSVSKLNDLVVMATKSVDHDGYLWFAYPKKSGKIRTDITRDIGWNSLIDLGFVGVTQISIDETWSALRFRPRDAVKVLTRKQTIGDGTSNKIKKSGPLVVPEEITEILSGNSEAESFFKSLAPSHQKAYVEWITSAKREETKAKRLEQLEALLLSGEKRP